MYIYNIYYSRKSTLHEHYYTDPLKLNMAFSKYVCWQICFYKQYQGRRSSGQTKAQNYIESISFFIVPVTDCCYINSYKIPYVNLRWNLLAIQHNSDYKSSWQSINFRQTLIFSITSCYKKLRSTLFLVHVLLNISY